MWWRNQWEKAQETDIEALNLGCLGERRGRVVVAVVAAAAMRLRAVVETEAVGFCLSHEEGQRW